MAACFYKLHQNNLLYGENVLDEKYVCAIIEGDWKLLEFKFRMNIWQEYQITELNQKFKSSVDKHLVTIPMIYDSQYC